MVISKEICFDTHRLHIHKWLVAADPPLFYEHDQACLHQYNNNNLRVPLMSTLTVNSTMMRNSPSYNIRLLQNTRSNFRCMGKSLPSENNNVIDCIKFSYYSLAGLIKPVFFLIWIKDVPIKTVNSHWVREDAMFYIKPIHNKTLIKAPGTSEDSN